jgi:hypothetical protein
MPNDLAKLLGAWRLRSCVARDVAGGVSYPYGRSPSGCILYTPSGVMAVSLMGDTPPRVEEPDVFAGAAHALASGAHRYIGYSGRYRLEGAREVGAGVWEGTVVHALDTCSYPNWIGTEQRRELRLEGDWLTLTTPPIVRGGVRSVAVVEWERAGPP